MATINTATVGISNISSDGKQLRGHSVPNSQIQVTDPATGTVIGKTLSGPDGSWRMFFATSVAAIASTLSVLATPPGSADSYSPPSIGGPLGLRPATVLNAVFSARPAAQLPLFGVCMFHVKDVAGAKAPVADAKNTELLNASGVGVFRTEIQWSAAEPTTKGTYVFNTESSAHIEAFASTGKRPLIIANGGNPLYGARAFNDLPKSQVEYDGYANFLKAIWARFGYLDPIIEGPNEPNNPAIWTYLNNVSEANAAAPNYAALMNTAIPALRSVAPNAIVLPGGLATVYAKSGNFVGVDTENYFEAFRTALTDAAVAGLNGWAMHPYFDPSDGTTPENNFWYLVMGAPHFFNGARAKPWYTTEQGVYLTNIGGDLNKQAKLVARSITNAIVVGMKLHVHYNLIDDGTDYTNAEFGLGLNTFSYSQKPVGTVVSAIMAALSGCVSYDYATLGDLRVIKVRKAGGALRVIAWTVGAAASFVPFDGGPVVALTEPGGVVIV